MMPKERLPGRWAELRGIFGVSGTGMDVLFQPGANKGQLTKTQLVGKYSPNPDNMLYNNDWNNFAPAVGFSWSIPYFGENKTTLRMGYGWAYERVSFRLLDVVGGDLPGPLSNHIAVGQLLEPDKRIVSAHANRHSAVGDPDRRADADHARIRLEPPRRRTLRTGTSPSSAKSSGISPSRSAMSGARAPS